MASAATAVDVEEAAAVHKWTAAAATSLVTTDSLLGLAGFLATVPKERAEGAVSTDDDFERVHSGWHREFGIAGLLSA
ncbi:hypothetical protein OAN61_00630 [bacterium]|nr:hypothetical protein [bacterium]